MNLPFEQSKQRSQAEIEAEIERMICEQGVEPFNFAEAVKDMSGEWSEEDERVYEEFMAERHKERQAAREAEKRQWQS
jgi:hypothetical protein